MEKTYCFTLVSDMEDCGVVFFDRKTGEEISRVPFDKNDRIGKCWQANVEIPVCRTSTGDSAPAKGKNSTTGAASENGKNSTTGTSSENGLIYQFYEIDKTNTEKRFPDPKGKCFVTKAKYGEVKKPEEMWSIIMDSADTWRNSVDGNNVYAGANVACDGANADCNGVTAKGVCFDWQNTEPPHVPYEDAFVYCLHVRGFTKHASSKVKARGTFAGLVEKIPYLKNLGVTTLEFQPIYEFIEKKNETTFINYWGYTEGYYYAPKADYAAGNPVEECKTMIRELHKNGMEAVLQFYFPNEMNFMEIPDILRFWVKEYQVDGFHLIGENLPGELIARDPMLSDTKIWYYQMDDSQIYGRHCKAAKKTLALVRDDFLYDGRRFLKSEENTIPGMMYHMRAIPARMGQLHYLDRYWGFTLMDLVSYDFKHNEANREENHDGQDANFSWNCGEEGPSRKKKVQRMRVQQLKNVMCLLFFAQSTPAIFMGDEAGHSQKGNNNPYCQDNEITWLNWKEMEKNQELTEFFQMLMNLRKNTPVLHPAEEAKLMDSLSCGYPDLSFHGQTAWRPQMENYSRKLGVMYCCRYGADGTEMGAKENTAKSVDDRLLYLAMNMHQEPHELALPRLQKGKKWVLQFSTCDEMDANPEEQDLVKLPARCMALYVSAEDEDSAKKEALKKETLKKEAGKKEAGKKSTKTGQKAAVEQISREK